MKGGPFISNHPVVDPYNNDPYKTLVHVLEHMHKKLEKIGQRFRVAVSREEKW